MLRVTPRCQEKHMTGQSAARVTPRAGEGPAAPLRDNTGGLEICFLFHLGTGPKRWERFSASGWRGGGLSQTEQVAWGLGEQRRSQGWGPRCEVMTGPRAPGSHHQGVRAPGHHGPCCRSSCHKFGVSVSLERHKIILLVFWKV